MTPRYLYAPEYAPPMLALLYALAVAAMLAGGAAGCAFYVGRMLG